MFYILQICTLTFSLKLEDSSIITFRWKGPTPMSKGMNSSLLQASHFTFTLLHMIGCVYVSTGQLKFFYLRYTEQITLVVILIIGCNN